MDTCTSFKLFSPMAQLYKKRRVGPKSNSTLDPKGIIKKCKAKKRKQVVKSQQIQKGWRELLDLVLLDLVQNGRNTTKDTAL